MMLEFIVFQSESAQQEVISRDLLAFSDNGVNIVFNYNGEIKVRQCPARIQLKSLIHYYTPGSWSANRFIKWPSLLFHLHWILIKILWKDGSKRFIAINGDILGWSAQLFKFFGRIKRTVFAIEDWSMPIAQLDFFGRFNIWKIRMHDRLLMWFDTAIVFTQKEINALRIKYWGQAAAKNVFVFDRHLYRFYEPQKNELRPALRKKILFFATMRPYNGLEMVFKILPELNRTYGFTLKVISPATNWYVHYQKLAAEMNVNSYIEWRGFVPNEQLAEEFDDCFCGLNIQELEGNSQQFAVAGRLMNYLQFLVVPIATRHSGLVIELIQENNLGLICEPNENSIRDAILRAHSDHQNYVANMREFWRSNSGSRDVRIYLDPEIVAQTKVSFSSKPAGS